MIEEIENEIIRELKEIVQKRTFASDGELRRIIEDKVKSRNYLKENWQIGYAVDRIKDEVNKIKDKDMENTSGQGKESIIPNEIKTWNWGAFLLTWIWGLSNKTYIALLCFIPYIGIVMSFILGAKGNEWAWRNRRWESIDHFQKVQKEWTCWGIAIFLFGIIFYILLWIIL